MTAQERSTRSFADLIEKEDFINHKSEKRLFHDISIRIAKLINIVLMTVPFAVAWYSCYADLLWVKFWMRGHWLVIGLFVLLYFSIGRIYEAFKMSYSGYGEMVYSQMLSLFEVDVIMYIIAFLLIRRPPAVLPFIIVYIIQGILAVVWSHISKNWYFKAFPAQKTVIVWDMRESSGQLISKYNLRKKFKVVDVVHVEDCIDDLSVLDGADTVFLSGIRSHDRNIIAKYCLVRGITAHLIPRIGDLIITGAKREHMFHLMMLKVERFNPTLEYVIAKRTMDIVLSLVALILLSPIILITAICIKLEDGGPVLYKQCRLTKDGKRFNILKFRSMRTDAEKDGIARLSSGDDDDRITKIGRVIRKCRIDELPQLVNLLKGDRDIIRTTKRSPLNMRLSAA